MDSLLYELKIEIFKYVDIPLSLLLTNRKWYMISQDPYARANWAIYKYGRAHVLLNAVSLGKDFVSINVIQALLGRGAIISRYFVQRLSSQFGNPDQRLINMKAQDNGNCPEYTFQLQKSSWVNELPLQTFTYLLTEALNALDLDDNELILKRNDMELFYFLTAGPFNVNLATQILYKNLERIKDLILNKRFIPFPHRPDSITFKTSVPFTAPFISPNLSVPSSISFITYINSVLDYRDGYEAIHQMNLIARAIIICPDLVMMWKQIGYDEIITHYNYLVLKGTILILFPSIKPANWTYPEIHEVVKRLRQFIDLGFQLTDSVMRDSFELYLDKFQELQILLKTFYIFKGDSVRKNIDHRILFYINCY